MCGRYVLYSPIEVLIARFGIKQATFGLTPRYNIAPEQEIPVIIQSDEMRLVGMRWGLIPFWTKQPSSDYSTINARAETLELKPTYRHSFRNRRCLIPSDGFYEWKGTAGRKTPYFIRLRSQEPFAFAGLYDIWEPPEGMTVTSAAIVTTTPNELLSKIHNRMPVILSPEEQATWLDRENNDPSVLRAMLDPYPSEEMEVYRVSTYVNTPSNEGPTSIVPEV